MPTGVYERNPEHRVKIMAALALGHSEKSRKKAIASLKENATDPEWREMVSAVTREAMHRPDVREKHLSGLDKARGLHGVNFRGGNGQEPVEVVKSNAYGLTALGFIA